jgi:beta-N-acetylhexosaminidase
MTPLPSQMALGATWSTDLSSEVGKVQGKELSALGFNLLIGPSLDVLEVPTTDSGGDLGIRTFGGDPFWVGALGQAYITGIHQGSSGKMVVASKHFPGFGGSDRLPEEEVATVLSSLEQLKQIDLAPFFAVTGNAPNPESMTDALVVSHIRYQGFQGNIRATTRPVSFDPQAFAQLISLPAFDTWRQDGGVMIVWAAAPFAASTTPAVRPLTVRLWLAMRSSPGTTCFIWIISSRVVTLMYIHLTYGL